MVRCNWCLVLSAVVIGILSLAALVTSLDASARLATEIVDLSASSEQPVPCGIATPNLFALAASTALGSTRKRRDGVADTIRAALCTQADAASAIKDLIKGAPAPLERECSLAARDAALLGCEAIARASKC